MGKIKEQFNRVKRWHERFKEFLNDSKNTDDIEYGTDILYAFFQNCWHLKDWIINSRFLDKKTVDDFFHSNTDGTLTKISPK